MTSGLSFVRGREVQRVPPGQGLKCKIGAMKNKNYIYIYIYKLLYLDKNKSKPKSIK